MNGGGRHRDNPPQPRTVRVVDSRDSEVTPMLATRLAGRIRKQDWFAVLLELAVVIVGILVAFQIDRWREQRHDRIQEVSYVQRLIGDVESDIPRIQRSITSAEQRLGFAELLMAAVRDPAVATAEPGRFLVAVEHAAFTNAPTLAMHTFDDLRATGNLGLIRNGKVKELLYAYHATDQGNRQYQQLTLGQEQYYLELVAGVKDYPQAAWVTDNFGPALVSGDEARMQETRFDAASILAAVERLRARPAAVDWIPGLRDIQVYQRTENQERLQHAESLLKELRAYFVLIRPD
jgi:hypothetical protein